MKLIDQTEFNELSECDKWRAYRDSSELLSRINKYEDDDKKDWLYTFAGQAMQGLLANHAGENYTANEIASDAALMASALIAELEKRAEK